MSLQRKICYIAISLTLLAGRMQPFASAKTPAETQYLLFQIFTYLSREKSAVTYFPPQESVQNVTDDIVRRIGVKGDAAHKLGICVGPLTLNQSDKEVRDLIHMAFSVAKTQDVAVGFHIDDQMFWNGRQDFNNKDCIEWTDFAGTLCTGRRLEWGPKPVMAPPALCLNSPRVKSVMKQRGELIGHEIANELHVLKAAGKDYLFAGVIAGWETMIGRDFDTNKRLGFHALKNRNLDESCSRTQADNALVQVLREHMELWSNALASQGIPKNKIYCHVASLGIGEESPTGQTHLEATGYAPITVAFNKFYKPGFSTYPDTSLTERLDAALQNYGRTAWISAEGTNVLPNGMPGAATMETYLAERFSRGAVAVNIFSWGIGGEAERTRNIFRRATENDEALAAYRKFLRGQKLIETKRQGVTAEDLRAKVRAIQTKLPAWVQRTHRQSTAEALMHRLDAAIKGGDFYNANATADEALRTISAP